MQSNSYEHFRTVLTMNLCGVLPPDQLNSVLQAVDVSLSEFEISTKQMDLITAGGVPEVVKLYIASRSISNLSLGTLKQYSRKLVQFFEDVRKPYTDITANDVRMYLYRYKEQHGAGDRYIENIRVTLNTFFQWLADNDYLQKNPCAKVDHIKFTEKKREPLTPYDLELFRWTTQDAREKALIDFFFSTGCRLSECSQVRLSDICWQDRSVRIRHGKGDKERTVYFNAEAEVSLRKYLASRTDATDALFVSCRAPHRALCNKALEDIITKVSKRTGLHVYPHRLRHTFATSGLRGGMPLEKLQALLGHVKPETTLIYAKLDQLDLQREHQRIYS